MGFPEARYSCDDLWQRYGNKQEISLQGILSIKSILCRDSDCEQSGSVRENVYMYKYDQNEII